MTVAAARTKRPPLILGEYSKRQMPRAAHNRLMRVTNRGLVVQREAHIRLLLVSTVFSLAREIAPRSERPQGASERSGAMAGANSKALIFCCYGAQRRCLKSLGPG